MAFHLGAVIDLGGGVFELKPFQFTVSLNKAVSQMYSALTCGEKMKIVEMN
ncbi:hypothetical protein VIBR0546_12712 [Vibrio brasiliensis LMG 20546]|uniref:Uncharacterized protein n=1 Tax=Vibrio brasiliensis LMG 20546 TaxID=945543 RepID=E8LP37_9VIBR|nr:hypothetical protein VIBR0546_12712 [Vibrio brasiliensis LMG 20546]